MFKFRGIVVTALLLFIFTPFSLMAAPPSELYKKQEKITREDILKKSVSIKNLYTALQAVEGFDLSYTTHEIGSEIVGIHYPTQEQVSAFIETFEANWDDDCCVNLDQKWPPIKTSSPKISSDATSLVSLKGRLIRIHSMLYPEKLWPKENEHEQPSFKELLDDIYCYAHMQYVGWCGKKMSALQEQLASYVNQPDKGMYLFISHRIVAHLHSTIAKNPFFIAKEGSISYRNSIKLLDKLSDAEDNLRALTQNYDKKTSQEKKDYSQAYKQIQQNLNAGLGYPLPQKSLPLPEFLGRLLLWNEHVVNKTTYEKTFPEQAALWKTNILPSATILDNETTKNMIYHSAFRWSDEAVQEREKYEIHIKKASDKDVSIKLSEQGLKRRVAASKEGLNFSPQKASKIYNKNKDTWAKINHITAYLSMMAEEFDLKRTNSNPPPKKNGLSFSVVERFAHWKEVEELNDLLSDPTELYKDGTNNLRTELIAAKINAVINALNSHADFAQIPLTDTELNFKLYSQHISDLWKYHARQKDLSIVQGIALSHTLVGKEKPTDKELTALAAHLKLKNAKVKNGDLWISTTKTNTDGSKTEDPNALTRPSDHTGQKYFFNKTSYPSWSKQMGARWRLHQNGYEFSYETKFPQIKQK